MPLDFFANSSGISYAADVAGKAPMTLAPPVSPMTQIPQYCTTTTARPVTGCRRKLVGSLPWGIPTVVVYR